MAEITLNQKRERLADIKVKIEKGRALPQADILFLYNEAVNHADLQAHLEKY